MTINRPEAMNALNEEVVEQLHEALDEIDAMDGIRGLVLDGAGKAFVAGADVKFFVDRIRASAIPDIEAFTARGKALFDRIEALEYPTVALTTGLALGGGLEPRTDLRPPHRDAQDHIPLSRDLHRHLPSARRHPTPSQDLRTSGREVGRPRRQSDGPRDRACDGAPDRPGGTLRGGGDARRHPRFRCLTGSLSWVARRPRSSSVRFATSFFSDANMSTILDGTIPEGFAEDPMAHRQMKLLGRAAPVGLAMASERIDAAATTTLQEGLQMELDGLNGIFSTHDALEGLSALLEHRRPDYTGA